MSSVELVQRTVKIIYQGPVVHYITKLLANVTLKYQSLNMANTCTLIFFVEKNVSSFCIAKATHIFAAKISMYLKIPKLQQLMSLS